MRLPHQSPSSFPARSRRGHDSLRKVFSQQTVGWSVCPCPPVSLQGCVGRRCRWGALLATYFILCTLYIGGGVMQSTRKGHSGHFLSHKHLWTRLYLLQDRHRYRFDSIANLGNLPRYEVLLYGRYFCPHLGTVLTPTYHFLQTVNRRIVPSQTEKYTSD